MDNQPNNNIMDTKKSITPSGFFGSSSDMIQAREDFMTKEEHEFLLNAAKKITHWDVTETHYNEDGTVIYDSEYWKDRVATGNTLNQHDPEINRVIEKMVQRFKKEVDDFFMVDADPTSPAIVRWLPGQLQMPHADKELHEGSDAGKPNDFPWYDLAGLFYLNDDYDGGELYFPQHDIKFKPKAGAAYFFPGDMNYIHGVTEITSGTRYVIPFFWTINRHTGERQPDHLILEK
jgi:predicted 2-oxoglutarate/Fe(II)-dependent dioxygenase YbiX